MVVAAGGGGARMKPRGGLGGGGEQPAVRKGPWTAEEDEVLRRHVREHGPREWSSIRSKGLLPRTGKSCRLRWVNKLRPDLKTYVMLVLLLLWFSSSSLRTFFFFETKLR